MKRYIYVGTYTQDILSATGEIVPAKSKGIYRFLQDVDTGEMRLDTVWEGIENPSFLAVNRRQDRLYAVNELQDYEGRPQGSVSAFAMEGRKLRPLGRMGTGGEHPCHVVLNEVRRSLYVANYTGGSIAHFRLDEEGSLKERRQLFQHQGHGLDPERQEAPHAHSVTLWAGYAYGVDLGLDQILCYAQDGEGGLTARPERTYHAAPGAGPRMCVFSPDGQRMYSISELDSTVSVAALQKDGSYKRRADCSTLPPADAATSNSGACIRLNLKGNFLYASNRGHNSIAVFEVEGDALTPVQYAGCGGEIPRDFTLTPDDRFLICANQSSDTLTVFAISLEDGTIKLIQTVPAPTPVCVVAGLDEPEISER